MMDKTVFILEVFFNSFVGLEKGKARLMSIEQERICLVFHIYLMGFQR